MTMDVSPTRLSVRRSAFIRPHDAVKYLSDRVVLTAAFITLFYLYYTSSPIKSFADSDILQSRAIGGAEILGFVAIFVILGDLKADRVGLCSNCWRCGGVVLSNRGLSRD
jgi:hypothetical protein